MYGALLGDMIGAPYEFDRGNKSKKFPMFSRGSKFTDDSVMTVAVAEALLGKGALLGTTLSFMMAVTTLSLPSLIMLRKAVKPRLLGTFIAICVIGIILVGYGFNAFQTIFI